MGHKTKVCLICGADFPAWVEISGRLRNLTNRKYCLVCSPFGQHNTKRLHAKPQAIACAGCGSMILQRRRAKFCSLACAQRQPAAHRYANYIENWKAGSVSGSITNGSIHDYVRRYILDTHGRRCDQCGWGERNESSGRIPVEIDHIDGDWTHNSETNLRVLCPNCHSLTPTYKTLNKGKGRGYRAKYDRRQRARLNEQFSN